MAGEVKRLVDTPRLPHIGWNDISLRAADPLFAGVADRTPFYFVHSYVPWPSDGSTVIAEAEYGSRFPVAVRSDRRVGVQFHPERSGTDGLRVLSNFVAECSALGGRDAA